MGIADIRNSALSFANNNIGLRDFSPGEAGLPPEHMFEGVNPMLYAPAEYELYLTRSNPVFSVVFQKALYLASLPLRLFRFTGAMAQHNIPRMGGSDNPWRQLLGALNERGFVHNRMGRNMSARNAILNLSAASQRGMFSMYLTQRKMGVEEVSEGDAFELIHRVNPFWTLTRLLMMTQMSLGIWGQSYFVCERRSALSPPEEIWWVKPTRMFPILDAKRYIVGYEYEPISGGERIPFAADQVVRMYYPNPLDEFQALSPLSLARVYADHENASMQTNLNLHKQGLMPGAIVAPKHPTRWKPSQAQAIERQINARYGGYDRAHRWAVFRHDVQIHSQGITPEDAQFLEGMEYDLERIANAYGWPIDFISGKRTYENVEQAQKIAWTTIAAEGALLAADLTEQFLPLFRNDPADVFFFDTSGITVLQEDEATRWERERSQIDLVVRRNEWRAAHGLDAEDGGDQLYINEQFVPLSSVWAQLPSSVQPGEIGVTSSAEEVDAVAEKFKDGATPALSLNGTKK